MNTSTLYLTGALALGLITPFATASAAAPVSSVTMQVVGAQGGATDITSQITLPPEANETAQQQLQTGTPSGQGTANDHEDQNTVAGNSANDAQEQAQESTKDATDQARETSHDAQEQAQETEQAVQEQMQETQQSVQEQMQETQQSAEQQIQETDQEAKDSSSD